MPEIKNKPLLVYSASAGSGKTFSLVQTYLRLVLGVKDEKSFNPNKFAHILAMTFTNKAALEMKERIIEALNDLAYYTSFEEERRKKVDGVLNEVIKNTGLTPQVIQERSKLVLSHILHAFEDFNVLTIDKFSLRLIRTFSRDLDLQENFQITLDLDTMLNEVIDELISKVGRKGEEEITKLALTYAKSNSDDGSRWDFKNSLMKFSKVLTIERNHGFIKELLEGNSNTMSYKDIQAEISKMENAHKEMCLDLYNYFDSLSPNPDDYFQKQRGIYGFIYGMKDRTLDKPRIPSSYITAYLDNEERVQKLPMDPVVLDKLRDLLEVEQEWMSEYFTLSRIRRNFYNLELLKYVSQELERYKERENVIGIFEFGLKISELLSEENAPFVYERLGNRYNHYLLDEFQDTSLLQWRNLIPLVHESIAHNYDNLIVGDPKQAIYRFRNGLVEQFVELPEIYNPENNEDLQQISQYFKQQGVKLELEDNYRSKEEVVRFNNAFFKRFLDLSPENLKKYYVDIEQNPKKGTGGYVNIQVLDEKLNEDIESSYLISQIETCIEDGYFPGDICVLVRSNKEGTRYAKNLIAAGYSIVSSDSLTVSSDALVRLCIDYLNLRRNSSSRSQKIKFATSYYAINGLDPIEEIKKYWIEGNVGQLDFEAFVEDTFESKTALFFPYENLYDLGTKFLKLVKKTELENPYFHHLMELFQNFDNKEGPDIRVFLDRWDVKLKSDSIQMPESYDSIKIMTVHKSKGLEFPVVILPNLNWSISPYRGEQFVKADGGRLLYTQLTRDDVGVPEYMGKEYDKEYERILLDELNALYVAFTRPAERMYALLEKGTRSKTSVYYSNVNQLITALFDIWDGEEIQARKAGGVFEVGEALKKERNEESKSNVEKITPSNLTDFLWFPEIAFKDADAIQDESIKDDIKKGNQLHLLLSKTDDVDEIEHEAKRLVMLGRIDKKWSEELAKTAVNVLQLLEKGLSISKAIKSLSEQDLIMGEDEVKRPDKIYVFQDKVVVVDFKSGMAQSKYKKQVLSYINDLKDIGYTNVKGYLLYSNNLKLEPVGE